MSLAIAQKGMKDLAVKAKAVMDDKSLTVAEKHARMDRIEADLAKFKDEISLHKKARQYMVGGASLGGDDDQPRTTSSLRAPALDYGWDGKSYGGPSLAVSDVAGDMLAHSVQTKSVTRVELAMKDASTDLSGSMPAVMDGTPIQFLREPTRISSLMPTIPMPARVLEYLRVNGVTGSATTVAPGGVKPELTISAAPVEAIAAKIAAHAGITDESLQDYANTNAIVEDVVSRAVIDAENGQILSGDGTGTNMTGILHTSGVLTRVQASGEDPFDTLRKADFDLRTGGSYTSATAYVMNPETWMDISLIRDNYGRFQLGEPGSDIAQVLWGRPVVQTTEIAAGTVLAANFTLACAVGFRRGLSIETGWDGNDFTENITRFRAEERVGLAVFRPSALNVVTLGTPTGKAA